MAHTPSAGSARDGVDDRRPDVPRAKTSAAATFALVFGLSALTLLLAPLAVVLAVIGVVLGVAGLKMAERVGVTGKALAIAGLVMSVLALLLVLTAVIGVTTFLNDGAAVDRLEQQVQDLRDRLPTEVDLPGGS